MVLPVESDIRKAESQLLAIAERDKRVNRKPAPETAVASSPPEITNLAHAPDSAAPAGYNHLAVRPRKASAGVN